MVVVEHGSESWPRRAWSSRRLLSLIFCTPLLRAELLSAPTMVEREGLLLCPPPALLFGSRERSTDQGRLNFSSATVSVSPVPVAAGVGIVWRHLRLRPLAPVVKMQVPCHGEEKVKCWFRMLILVGLGREGAMSSEVLRSGRSVERGWARLTSLAKGDTVEVDVGVAGDLSLVGRPELFLKSDKDSNGACFANFW